MNEVLSNTLHTLYPTIYGNSRYITDKELNSPVLHFEVQDGWFGLLNYLGNFLVDKDVFGLYVVQAKEKYGILTVYITCTSQDIYNDIYDEVHDELDRIRFISETICEYCSLPGSLRLDRLWVKTLCDKCNSLH